MTDPTGTGGAGTGGDDPTGDGNAKAIQRLQTELDAVKRAQSGSDNQVTVLQRQLSQVTQERDTALQSVTQLDGRVTDLTGQLGTVQARIPELEGSVSARDAQLAEMTSTVQKATIVAAEFPQLRVLLQNDSLPAFTDADQFRARLTDISKGLPQPAPATQVVPLGSPPPIVPPAGGTGKTFEEAQAELMEAINAGKPSDVVKPLQVDYYRMVNDQLRAGDIS